MSKTGAYDAKDVEEQTLECEHCGCDRPLDTRRFVLTVQDHTDATADFDRTLLCRSCWNNARNTLRRWSS